jgi:hypothetical protein
MECNACKLVELSLASLMSIEKEKKRVKKEIQKQAKEGKKEEIIIIIK